MEALRTPDSAFELIGFDFEPCYISVPGPSGTPLRMHYIDEGPRDGGIVLCLHGQPSWSFLYRKMVAPLTAVGLRVIAPDLIGFGKSDKPAHIDDYSYARHVDWVGEFVTQLALKGIIGLFQDWGGMIGMRLVERMPNRFAGLVVTNTLLLDSGDVSDEVSDALGLAYPDLAIPSAVDVAHSFAQDDPLAVARWIKYATENPDFSVSDVFSTITGLDDPHALAGYEAPFPDRRYMAGAIAFPGLFPVMPEQSNERRENDRVWKSLSTFTKPVLTAFSDGDQVTRGYDQAFQDRIAGAKGMPHLTIPNAGHYVQDEKPAELARAVETVARMVR